MTKRHIRRLAWREIAALIQQALDADSFADSDLTASENSVLRSLLREEACRFRVKAQKP